MEQTKNENGVSYVNHESVPVEFIIYDGSNGLEVSGFLSALGVPGGNLLDSHTWGNYYPIVADSYRDADEECPKKGDVYVVFPNKKVVLYTPGEFEANFKLI